MWRLWPMCLRWINLPLCCRFNFLLLFLIILTYFYNSPRGARFPGWNLDDDYSTHNLDWRERLALQSLPSLFSKEVLDVIIAGTADLGPLSLDNMRKNKADISENSLGDTESLIDVELLSDVKPNQIVTAFERIPSIGNESSSFVDDNDQSDNRLAEMIQKHNRQERIEKRAAELVLQDDEAAAKLESAAIERSRSVDIAVQGKYSIWEKEEKKKPDSTVCLLRDQIIMARVYMKIARLKNKLDLLPELQRCVQGNQLALGEAMVDIDLHHSTPEKIKDMGQVLSKGREKLYDCKLVTQVLRAMYQRANEHAMNLQKRSTFLQLLAAKMLPKEIHCLSMRMTIDYYTLPPEKRKFPRSENLEDPSLYHYALFSDNVLAASVVVTSTIANAEDPSRHVFHIVTNTQNFGAMNMWFLSNLPGNATIHIENVDEFKWLNSSYCPVLRQLESAIMKEYYYKADNLDTLSAGYSDLKYRNPKYLSMLNHLRFYLPEVYPKLDKILFLDDDIVVQKDLTPLWWVDLQGKVNGAVETCGESFHRLDTYLNFTNSDIARNFHPKSCAWAYGMNIFDLEQWKQKNITGIYHKWQIMNENRTLWQLGTLPAGLISFYGLTHVLEESWHVLALGYHPGIDKKKIQDAAVIHYNGNRKPWLESAISKYQHYWTKYLKYDHPYLRSCSASDSKWIR